MTHFEIISIMIAFLTLTGGLLATFVKAKTDVAKIQVQVIELRGLIKINKDNGEQMRKDNREDHKRLYDKLEEINNKL